MKIEPHDNQFIVQYYSHRDASWRQDSAFQSKDAAKMHLDWQVKYNEQTKFRLIRREITDHVIE